MSVAPYLRRTPAQAWTPTTTEPEQGLVVTDAGHLVDELSITSSHGYTLEDLDPTPVPTGCPRCWEGPGARKGRCTHCPASRRDR